jgi:hypothetical protein
MFRDVRSLLLGDQRDRDKIAMFQNWLSDSFFSGQDVILIPREKADRGGMNDVLFVKIGDEEERPVYDLGDGVQHVIILTWPLFQYQEDQLALFIEEPELYLHPGFQRLFIEAALKLRKVQPQVFVASHSSQFVDITLDDEKVAVFCCRAPNEKMEHFTVEPMVSGEFSILADLGIRNSSVMLANCTIWVEGITDRLYFRKYLEIVQRDQGTTYKEDLHYAFVGYGGGNITHWSFLDEDSGINAERVCGRLILVSDQDDGKEERHSKLKAALGDSFVLLPVREVENLLTASVLVEVVKEYEGDDVELAPAMEADYASEPLGKYIEESLLPQGKSMRTSKSGHPYMAESGTLKGKLDFAKRAIQRIDDSSKMTEDSTKLAETLLDFIAQQNPGPWGGGESA